MRKRIVLNPSRFSVNFKSLLILANVCIPSSTKDTYNFLKELIDTHYHAMTPYEREKFYYKIMQKISRFSLLDTPDEILSMLLSRFNSDKNRNITVVEDGISTNYDAFVYNDRLYISSERYVKDEILV